MVSGMGAILALAVTTLQPAAPQRAADIAALTDAKLRMWPGYYRNNDAVGLEAFLADNFVQFSESGNVETKAAAVAWVRTNRWTNAQRDFRYDIRSIVFLSDDVANVYGVGSFDRAGGPACRMTYTSANIFVRQGGRWRPAFSHVSDPACAAPPAPAAPSG